MNIPNIPGFLIADWVMVLMAIGAPVAFALRARRIALVLATPALFNWIIHPILSLIVDGWPWWALGLTYAVVALLLLQIIIALIFGRGTAEEAIGQLIAYAIRGVFWAVWRIPHSLWISFSIGRRAYLRRRASFTKGTGGVSGTAAMNGPEVTAASPLQQVSPVAPDLALKERVATDDEDKLVVDKFDAGLETAAQGATPSEAPP